MKCIICGNDLKTGERRCNVCGTMKNVSAYSSVFSWSDNDKKVIHNIRNVYMADVQKKHDEEQKRIQEENRRLEEQRKADQKLADERNLAEAKKREEEARQAEQLRTEQERIRKEREEESKREIERVQNEENLRKSRRKRNIIIGVIVFLIIAGIASNFEQQSSYTPIQQPTNEEINTTSSTNVNDVVGESSIDYVNNDWASDRVVLNNWEVPFKLYDKYIENCNSFTLEFSISDVIDGNPYGVWIVYLRDKNGVWNEITTFAHSKSHGEAVASVEIKSSNVFEPFNAIALARKSNDTSNHSFWYDTKKFVISN